MPFLRRIASVRGARLLSCAVLLLVSNGAHAALKCTISATDMDFGLYSPLNPAPHNITSTVTAICRGGLGLLRFRLSPGNSGDATNRQLVSAGGALNYNIYTNTARTQIWGDGAGGTSEVFRIQFRRGRTTHNVTAYGSIPGGQNAATGIYTDNIVITVIF